jgi:hypothetical protein
MQRKAVNCCRQMLNLSRMHDDRYTRDKGHTGKEEFSNWRCPTKGGIGVVMQYLWLYTKLLTLAVVHETHGEGIFWSVPVFS